MPKTTPKNVLVTICVIVAISVLYVFVYWPHSPLGKQLQNLAIAKVQAGVLKEKFKDDPRFKQITFGDFTGLGGCLKVWGMVATEDDYFVITNLVEAAKCPVAIDFELMTSSQSSRFWWFDQGEEPPSLQKAND